MFYSLLMCPAEDWRAQARWNGSIADSRKHLLQELTSKLNKCVLEAYTDLARINITIGDDSRAQTCPSLESGKAKSDQQLSLPQHAYATVALR
jgi:hypothetical protein